MSGSGKSTQEFIYCQQCGQELLATANFCENCGARVGTTPTPQQAVGQQPVANQHPPEQDSDAMFKATCGLVGGYFVFLLLGLVTFSNGLLLLALLMLPISLITMYVDLRELDGILWDTRPILWVVAAILLYIVVVPLYIYKRRQWSHTPDPHRVPA